VPPEFIQELQTFLVEHGAQVSEAVAARADLIFTGIALDNRACEIIEKLIRCDAFLSSNPWITSRFLPSILPAMAPYLDRVAPMAKTMICAFISRVPSMLILMPSLLESVFKSEENGPVHEGYSCDGCGMDPIRGIRYRCTVRPDFDLCEACEARPRPESFPMTKIRVPIVEDEAGQPEAKDSDGAPANIVEDSKQEPVVAPVAEPVGAAPVEPVVAEPVVAEPVVAEPVVVEPVVVEPVVVEPVVVEPVAEPVVAEPVVPLVVAPVARPQRPASKYSAQVSQLQQMGFVQDIELLEGLLDAERGDVQKVMDALLR